MRPGIGKGASNEPQDGATKNNIKFLPGNEGSGCVYSLIGNGLTTHSLASFFVVGEKMYSFRHVKFACLLQEIDFL